MAKTHWKQLVDTRFIGAHSLPEGKDLTVIIESVSREALTMEEGEDHYLVARLTGQLPMILNATNAKTITRLYGPYIEEWAGKPITLFASQATLNDELVECLRIRPTQPRAPEPLSNTRFKRALQQITAGQYSAGQLRERYALTAEQASALDNLTAQTK